MSELGLAAGFTLTTANYSVNRSTGEVACYLQYANTQNDNRIYKSARVDAKTGELTAFNSYGTPAAAGSAVRLDEVRALAAAEEFLQTYQAEKYSAMMLFREESQEEKKHTVTFAQAVNGIPFPQNAFAVTIDQTDGTVSAFHTTEWKDDVVFENADGVIGEAAALEAYLNEFETTLQYIAVPVDLRENAGRYAAYLEAGYSYLYEWKLGYALEAEGYFKGIDAKSGEILVSSGKTANRIAYTDISAAAYPQILALAEYGVGYLGGTFEPDKALTQLDLVVLLMSADGYQYDPEDGQEGTEWLYERAYRQGILKRTDAAPDKRLTRAELVRILIDSTGYGKAAGLTGIYIVSFTDASAIAESDLGYIAIAQGLGLVQGDEYGRFQPAQTATREQAAIILYNFMAR